MKIKLSIIRIKFAILLILLAGCGATPPIIVAITSTNEPKVVETANTLILTETPKPTDTTMPIIEPSATSLPATPTLQPTSTQPPTYTPSATLQIPGTISIDVDILNNYDDFPAKATTLDVLPGGRMRLNLYFWNKSNQDRYFFLNINDCAYLADTDNGTQYKVLDSTLRPTFTHIQPQVKVEHWIEFEDAVSSGGRNFTVNLCSLVSGAAARFKQFNIHIP